MPHYYPSLQSQFPSLFSFFIRIHSRYSRYLWQIFSLQNPQITVFGPVKALPMLKYDEPDLIY
jgi:hypothetical protein